MANRKGVLWILLFLGLGGCAATEDVLVSAKNYTQGEYFLRQQDYADCVTTFETEIAANPHNASAHFYLGRCCLAVEENQCALQHLTQAVNFDQDNPDYYFWKGVAHATNKDAKRERQSYERALILKPDHIQALVYLGHNHLEAGDPRTALGYYNRALKLDPVIPAALYNRALGLRKLKRTPEEIEAWETYLAHYSDGAFARQAVAYLNRYGRFDHRNHTIGRRTLCLAQIRFEPSSPQIRKESLSALKQLARVVAQNPNLVLHIVAYQKNNRQLAELRSKSIRRYLSAHGDRIAGGRLKTSWFDQPESVNLDGHTYRLDSSVNFFGQLVK